IDSRRGETGGRRRGSGNGPWTRLRIWSGDGGRCRRSARRGPGTDGALSEVRNPEPSRREVLLELRRHATGSRSRFRGMPFVPRAGASGNKVLFELRSFDGAAALQELPGAGSTGREVLRQLRDI